jgi:hypothetical protein
MAYLGDVTERRQFPRARRRRRAKRRRNPKRFAALTANRVACLRLDQAALYAK